MKHRRRGQGTLESDSAGVERGLRRLDPAAVPQGLGERTLERAAEAARGAMLRPWMRLAAAAASALIVAVIAAGPVIDRSEAVRMAAILDGRPAVPSGGEEAGVLAEALGGEGAAKEASRLARLESLAAAAARRDRERQAIEAREWLKGWLEHETSEDLE